MDTVCWPTYFSAPQPVGCSTVSACPFFWSGQSKTLHRKPMIRALSLLVLALFFAIAPVAAAQQQEPTTSVTGSTAADDPVANPGRPTVSTPATLTPVGYFQFETGVLAAWNSPGVSSQESLNEVIKFSVSRWIELLASTEPFAHSSAVGQPANGTGDVDLGIQGIIHHGE